MSSELPRRHSSTHKLVPAAPPLPPARGPSRDVRAQPAGILDRILYGGRRQPAKPPLTAREIRGQLLFAPNLGYASSQTASHKTGLRLRALDINEGRSHVVLAGGRILKTVKVEQGKCVEDVNIRSSVLNAPQQIVQASRSRSDSNKRAPIPDVSASQRDLFDIEDVAWSNGRYSHQIATAAASGKVVLYDLQHSGVEVGRLHEHSRQVHKVDFCPIEGQLLLSASQDGTVRLWDLRTLRNVIKCESQDTFQGRNDGVRHTKWSPTSSATFALATDNGTVQKWDIRYNRAPALKISAHASSCSSIDWHPDGRHLVSGGKDKDVKVWDMRGDRKQKPACHLRAPQAIQNVRWRPPCYVSQGRGGDQLIKQCTHLATSYRNHPFVHIWDLRKPQISYRELHHQVNNGTTDMLWHSMDLLWTVGPEGEFTQSDIRYLPRTMDRRPLSMTSTSAQGDMAIVSQRRTSRSMAKTEEERETQSSSPSKASVSKSLESSGNKQGKRAESFEESFFSRSIPWHRRSRSESVKESQSLGSTPPSYEDFGKPVDGLDETMQRRRQQPSADKQEIYVGRWPEVGLDTAFKMRARESRTVDMNQVESIPQLTQAVNEVFSGYVGSASRGGHYLESHALDFFKTLLVEDLETKNKQGRYNEALEEATSRSRQKLVETQDMINSSTGQSDLNVSGNKPTQLLQGADESASGVATPVAKPSSSAVLGDSKLQTGTPPMDLIYGTLDSSFGETRTIHSSAGSGDADDGPESSTAHSLDLLPSTLFESPERRRSSLTDYKRPPQQPLRFESSESLTSSEPKSPQLDRRESSESYAFFPGSSGSARLKSAHGSFSNGIQHNPGRSLTHDSNENAALRELPEEPSAQHTESVIASTNASFSQQSHNEVPTRYHAESVDNHSKVSVPPISTRTGSVDDEGQSDNNLKQSQATIVGENPDQDEDEGSQSTLGLLKELLEHHSQTGKDAQMCSQLFICIAPLLSILQADKRPEEEDELSLLFVESMLSTYHEQLVAMELHVDAASLRKLCYPFFPAVYEQGEVGVDTAVACGTCGNSVTYVGPGVKCEACDSAQDMCPICWQLESPFTIPGPAPAKTPGVCDDPSVASLLPGQSTTHDSDAGGGLFGTLMTACSLCGHIVHMACGEQWFGNPENGGGCPVQSCRCACVPGRQRELNEEREKQAAKQALKEQKDQKEGRVRTDEWEVEESEAVRRVAGGLRNEM